MTSYIPLSLRKGLRVSLALTAATLLGVTGSNASAKSSNCGNKLIEETICFALTATADAPTGVTGQAKLESKETSTTTKAELKLDVKGLEVGTYSVDATLSDSTTVHLADLTVQEGRCQKRSSSRTSRTAKRGSYHHKDDDDDRDGDDDDDRDDDGDHHDCDENDDDGGTTTTTINNTKSKIEIAIPSTVDVSDITTITVSSATTDDTTVPPTTTSTVLLTGEPTSETSSVRFVANVRVTAPTASPLTTTPDASDDASSDDNGKGHGHGKGKGKGHHKGKHKNKHGRGHDEDEDSCGSQAQSIQGRALAMVCVSGGVEKKRVFQFIATGAPANTELNIVVDGETVDTVTSSKHGCVKFCGLPDTVDLRTIDLLTITDANGVVLMQADF